MADIQYYGTGRRKTSTARVYLRPGSGEITVRKMLVILGTGKVSGKIRYAKIKVEEGAELSGDLAVMDKSSAALAGKRVANA